MQLAALAANATYSATYTFHEASSDQSATVQVWRVPPALHVDVTVGSGAATTTASLIVGATATYSCSRTAKGPSCLTVAQAGQPLPAPFNVAPTSLFTTDLQQLATDISDYGVTRAPATAASGAVPAASCFTVTPLDAASASPTVSSSPSPSTLVVPGGNYCLSSNGLLVAATYPSGNTIRLTSADSATPAPAQFSPYAKPTPLPTK
ncbi:MAG TPA: hypothetical protein VFH54_13245 [Mycobacteriales bacterium]|nr:hypothetical protein [Mycobacteriales bacterium]